MALTQLNFLYLFMYIICLIQIVNGIVEEVHYLTYKVYNRQVKKGKKLQQIRGGSMQSRAYM